MSAARNLKEVYIDELKDLWSANDQMRKVMKDLTKAASNPELKTMLETADTGIGEHTTTIKKLIAEHDDDIAKDHCRGMEGLVKEARKHALDEHYHDDDVRDVVIIAQYQRMSHYGITGFGTVAAFAEALGLTKDTATLKAVTKDIYGGDEFATHLAKSSVNLAAK